ncbi:MAG: cobalamin-independent methionine synthase II family protein [Armatimonadetes bacterium]|nr:cobalamin-independent methionine synthase II family protein [Armatimonadota bacterium]MDW8121479.1 cobalamin-independent methionine synthase II family protein [Armatimonadota bacterium]
MRQLPTIRPLTTVVGSYPAPSWYVTMGQKAYLRDALMVVLKTQELAGVDVISDGEIVRFDPAHSETQGMVDYFLRPLDGMRTRLSAEEIQLFQKESRLRYRKEPAAVVVGRLEAGTLNLLADCSLSRSLTDKPLKFTVTSPYMLAHMVLDRFYGDRHQLAVDIARILSDQVKRLTCEVLQIDEPHLPGHPHDGPFAAEVINIVLDAFSGVKGVHLCFGNYGGQTIQKGFWKDLLPFFDSLKADHLVLEMARRGFQELEVFRDLPPHLSVGCGVVDIKDNEIESPETIARRIEKAVNVLGPERVQWVHPDCGLWMLHRSVADVKLRALVQGRDAFLKAGS